MPDCSWHAASAAATRLRQAIDEMAIPHDATPSTPTAVTVSGGVCCWTPGSDVSATELLRQADQALYHAKSAGRNRVQIAATDPVDLPAPILL